MRDITDYKPFEVELPWRLKRRPVYKGFPVPFLVKWVDKDTPDFRLSDPDRWDDCVGKKVCSLCGMQLGWWKWFVGGEISTLQTRLYFDPPVHQECGEYAFKVCPYLAMVRGYSIRPVLTAVKMVTGMKSGVPEKFGFGKSTGFKQVVHEGQRLIQAYPFREIRWFVNGSEL